MFFGCELTPLLTEWVACYKTVQRCIKLINFHGCCSCFVFVFQDVAHVTLTQVCGITYAPYVITLTEVCSREIREFIAAASRTCAPVIDIYGQCGDMYAYVKYTDGFKTIIPVNHIKSLNPEKHHADILYQILWEGKYNNGQVVLIKGKNISI